jgi:hypothetical protein
LIRLSHKKDVHTGSHASLAAQDFAASRGLLSSEKEVVAIQAPPSPLVIVFPAPAPGDDQTVNEVMSLSPYHGSTMTPYSYQSFCYFYSWPEFGPSIPPYLRLFTVIDVLKLNRDDDYMIQNASKNLLLQCLDTLEDEDEVPKEVTPKPSSM